MSWPGDSEPVKLPYITQLGFHTSTFFVLKFWMSRSSGEYFLWSFNSDWNRTKIYQFSKPFYI